MTIKIASESDLHFLKTNDRHLTQEELECLVARKRVYIAEQNGVPVGWLRWNLFWDNIPFMNMLYILEDYRGKNGGRQLVTFWEQKMRKLGYKFVMTSSQSDEKGQHFYRKLGYTDAGSLLLRKEPLEIIFVKYFTEKKTGNI